MISEKTFQQITLKYQTSEATVLREYFQNLFLSYFYQHKDSEKIYFKGGTALRLIYHSPRFSEDLDFSAALSDVAPIERAVLDTLHAVSKEGVKIDLKEATPTSGGYLAELHFTAYNRMISIRFEASLREGKKVGTFATVVNDFVPDYTILQLEERQLIGEKVTALLSRKKPRDFYDFYFLLRHNLLPEKNREMFEAVMKTLHGTKINFDSELKTFLPKSHHMIVKDFKAMLERELKRYI
ncbi:MAG: nucleotidyl transferase AbiEii/AbiGii toxin family protein [Candidatus Paceibacterota bacterium]|jgi:predicted nucleotidyltransferase component of viral defense system